MDDRQRFLLEDDLDGIDAEDVDLGDLDDDSEAMDNFIAEDVDLEGDNDFDALEREIDALGGGSSE